jgi:hypothetical protein
MRAKLEAFNDYEEMIHAFNVIALTNTNKGSTYQFEGHIYHAQSLHQVEKFFYSLHQGKDITTTKFLETFQTLVSVIEQYGGVIGHDPGTIVAKIIASGLALETGTTKSNPIRRESSRKARKAYTTMTQLTAQLCW